MSLRKGTIYEASGNVEISEIYHAGYRYLISGLRGLASPLGFVCAGAEGGRPGRILGRMCVCLGDIPALFPEPLEILGNLCADREESVVHQG